LDADEDSARSRGSRGSRGSDNTRQSSSRQRLRQKEKEKDRGKEESENLKYKDNRKSRHPNDYQELPVHHHGGSGSGSGSLEKRNHKYNENLDPVQNYGSDSGRDKYDFAAISTTSATSVASTLLKQSMLRESMHSSNENANQIKPDFSDPFLKGKGQDRGRDQSQGIERMKSPFASMSSGSFSVVGTGLGTPNRYGDADTTAITLDSSIKTHQQHFHGLRSSAEIRSSFERHVGTPRF